MSESVEQETHRSREQSLCNVSQSQCVNRAGNCPENSQRVDSVSIISAAVPLNSIGLPRALPMPAPPQSVKLSVTWTFSGGALQA